VFMIAVLGEVPDRASAVREAARVRRPGGCFSSTEAAGDPDSVNGMELDDHAERAGLAKGESRSGLLVKTFNYRKPSERGSRPGRHAFRCRSGIVDGRVAFRQHILEKRIAAGFLPCLTTF
jgi:hypothetical protein